MSNEARRRRLRDGLLLQVLPGICRLPGFETSWRQFVQATWMWLDGRGALSNTTSATVQGILDQGIWPIHVSSQRMSLPDRWMRIRSTLLWTKLVAGD